MTPSIAVFGAGPGLGQAVARRYAREGWRVVLIARHRDHLDQLAKEIGENAQVLTADLADTDAVPALAQQIRALVGDPDAVYYGIGVGTFASAAELTREQVESCLPIAVYSLLALVREFLPAMLERGRGAILSAQGASAVRGMPHRSGPGPAIAAQRNYLESLEREVADRNVYIGRLYIGAAITGSAWHAAYQQARANGTATYEVAIADADKLADQLWTMHANAGPAETTYPDPLFPR
ncbi:MAG TPA: SDR family NAD(P)-dependent oxidoreductase [Pseudonocardiaceae bacterium]|jgi:NADP-dependent 3-hydroxy acid dehydrogenase YdfG